MTCQQKWEVSLGEDTAVSKNMKIKAAWNHLRSENTPKTLSVAVELQSNMSRAVRRYLGNFTWTHPRPRVCVEPRIKGLVE